MTAPEGIAEARAHRSLSSPCGHNCGQLASATLAVRRLPQALLVPALIDPRGGDPGGSGVDLPSSGGGWPPRACGVCAGDSRSTREGIAPVGSASLGRWRYPCPRLCAAWATMGRPPSPVIKFFDAQPSPGKEGYTLYTCRAPGCCQRYEHKRMNANKLANHIAKCRRTSAEIKSEVLAFHKGIGRARATNRAQYDVAAMGRADELRWGAEQPAGEACSAGSSPSVDGGGGPWHREDHQPRLDFTPRPGGQKRAREPFPPSDDDDGRYLHKAATGRYWFGSNRGLSSSGSE